MYTGTTNTQQDSEACGFCLLNVFSGTHSSFMKSLNVKHPHISLFSNSRLPIALRSPVTVNVPNTGKGRNCI